MCDETEILYQALGFKDDELLLMLGGEARMVIAANLAIRELRRILPMDAGVPREKELERLLDNLVKLDEM